MKMLVAIINSDDAQSVVDSMMKEGYSITKLATTGGFLKRGNTTILTGMEEKALPRALEIIREHSKTRKQVVPTTAEFGVGYFPTVPVQVDVGGATVFVLDVEQFEKF